MSTEKRFSRQREAIIINLRSRTDHPSADDVYTSIREVYPNISLGTVYRNLNQLSADGSAFSFTVSGREHFDGNITPHYHFYCTKCGKIYDVFDGSVDKFMKTVSETLSCRADSAKIVIDGICNACLNAADTDKIQ